jgi:hypothetical protein
VPTSRFPTHCCGREAANRLLSFAVFTALYLVIALGFDMGIKYRVHVIYSVTHPASPRPPSYRIRFASRHVVLYVSAASEAPNQELSGDFTIQMLCQSPSLHH